VPIDEGTRVIDGDDNPNTPVVVWRPEAKTTADWIYEAGRETYTIAESNPTYPDDDQLIVWFSNAVSRMLGLNGPLPIPTISMRNRYACQQRHKQPLVVISHLFSLSKR
jgi:hypothetical protein